MKTKQFNNKEDAFIDENNERVESAINSNPQTEQANINPLEDKIKELTSDLIRTRADFENFRKQTENQKNQAMEITKLSTISKFLPLLDDIDRAILTYSEQLSPLKKSLDKTMKELKLEKINSEVNSDFDPELHDAVMFDESDGEKEVIAETLRPGYFYDGSVVRTAMVKVKKI